MGFDGPCLHLELTKHFVQVLLHIAEQEKVLRPFLAHQGAGKLLLPASSDEVAQQLTGQH